MARMARIKVDGEAAAYHVYGRIASFKGDYALSKPLCRKTLIDTFQHYASGYCCQVGAKKGSQKRGQVLYLVIAMNSSRFMW